MRPATAGDEALWLAMVAHSRALMRASGNPTQWPEGYPSAALFRGDVASGCAFMVEAGGRAVATFCLRDGEEPSYREIHGGAWPNDRPYATIHRLASLGLQRGVGHFVMRHCQAQRARLRADTHRDNARLISLFARHGFAYCGLIYVADGTERRAYQWERA
ncbi:MAG: N-acetyltransferase [Bacteroidia bacterium]|nr:MAG: N-acetyltransferase [Bacteroidia bacterium]